MAASLTRITVLRPLVSPVSGYDALKTSLAWHHSASHFPHGLAPLSFAFPPRAQSQKCLVSTCGKLREVNIFLEGK